MSEKEQIYNKWNIVKVFLDTNLSVQRKIIYEEREIWWTSIGLNVGQESYGKGRAFKRPVLILRKLSDSFFIGIPLSTKQLYGTWFVRLIINNQSVCALLYQI